MAVKTKVLAKRRSRRQLRLRRKLQGTTERPRICVFRSSKYTYAQVIDDTAGVTLASVSTRGVEGASTKSAEAAKAAGVQLGQRLKELGVESCVFDRAGFLFAGRVAALAEGVRDAGVVI